MHTPAHPVIGYVRLFLEGVLGTHVEGKEHYASGTDSHEGGQYLPTLVVRMLELFEVIILLVMAVPRRNTDRLLGICRLR